MCELTPCLGATKDFNNMPTMLTFSKQVDFLVIKYVLQGGRKGYILKKCLDKPWIEKIK